MSEYSELAEQVAEGLEVTAGALEALHLRIDKLEAALDAQGVADTPASGQRFTPGHGGGPPPWYFDSTPPGNGGPPSPDPGPL